MACVICSCIHLLEEKKESDEESQPAWKENAAVFMKDQIERAYFQIPAFLEETENQSDPVKWLESSIWRELPIYDYAAKLEETQPKREDEMTAELMMQQEGTDEDHKNIDEDKLDYGEDALHIENNVIEEMKRENSLHNTGEEQEVQSEQTGEPGENGLLGNDGGYGEFQALSYPAYTYDWSEEWNYDSLLSNFYAVDSSTLLEEEYVDLEKLLYQDLTVDRSVEGPQILIYHTHASEEFIDSVEGDPSTTIVGAGEKLADLLQNTYGFRVLHHKGVYDTVREDAYANALPEIEKLLEENPTIEVVIDLHRDAVSGDRKLVMDLQGRPTARFMFFNGLSYIRKSGSIAYLENPYIQENLALSFQAQVAANEYYPGIARKIYLKAYRYNMHLKPKSMLIELGAQNNTVEEIMNACDPIAHILAIVLEGDL